jgi:hypothetical protein
MTDHVLLLDEQVEYLGTGDYDGEVVRWDVPDTVQGEQTVAALIMPDGKLCYVKPKARPIRAGDRVEIRIVAFRD